MTAQPPTNKEVSPQDRDLMKVVEGYLREEGYRFHFIADDCIEMYLQGKHLTMRMLIYSHNRHLVVRVPGFIRGVEMRRTDLLLELMSLMSDFFDIRFELSPDGHSLSGASNHIVEDGQVTKKQFMQALMVVAYMVDENYPRFLKIIYGQTPSEEPFDKTHPTTTTTTEPTSGIKLPDDEQISEHDDADGEIIDNPTIHNVRGKPKLN